MRTTWIVIADAGRARIVSKIDKTGISVVRQIENPAGRAHNAELVSDAPGRFEKHAGPTRSAMDPPTDAHEHQAREFARTLLYLLDVAESRAEYKTLALVAPAHFLGLLRSEMKAGLGKKLVLCVAGDWTRLPLAELDTRLNDLLHFAKDEPHLVSPH